MTAAGWALVGIGSQAEPLLELTRQLLEDAGQRVIGRERVSDDPQRLKGLMVAALADPRMDVLLAVGGRVLGGTGPIEVMEGLMERRLDGFAEVYRMLSFTDLGPAAIFSRATLGFVRNRVLIALPGEAEAVERALVRLILPQWERLRTGE